VLTIAAAGVQIGDKCRKFFSLICKNVLTDPQKYVIMGAAGFVDFALALRFRTLALETSLSHFTFALRRLATFVTLSLSHFGAGRVRLDICLLISKATIVQIYVSKRLLTKLFHECSIVDKSVNSGDNSPSLKLPK
jgi:hypothetical protein